MIKLFTKKQYEKAKAHDKLPLECKQCEKTHYKTKNKILAVLNQTNKNSSCNFCSNKCQHLFQNPPIFVNCTQCGKKFKKTKSQMSKSKSGNYFCSRSCAATYNNLHKTTGTRRSKLEKWIEEQLTVLYTDLDIHFNKKDAINAELDIFIPSLNLAFELNGIYHYEPIHGQKKLNQVQNNDHRKYAACIENNIELCLIDTSSQSYFKPKTSQKFLDIVTSILDSKLVPTRGIEPLTQRS